jgi:hypothetical protein
MGQQLDDADGLAYAEVTRYVSLPAGTYTVRFVTPGAANCDTPLPGVEDKVGIQLESDKRYTVMAAGEIAPMGGAEELQLIAIEDDGEATSGKAGVRAIHASSDAPAVDVGLGAGNMFDPLFEGVAFGKAGMSNGSAYRQIDPVSAGSISVRESGGANDVLTVNDLDFEGSTLSTVFVIGNVDANPAPLGLLVCGDNAAPEDSLSACTRYP